MRRKVKGLCLPATLLNSSLFGRAIYTTLVERLLKLREHEARHRRFRGGFGAQGIYSPALGVMVLAHLPSTTVIDDLPPQYPAVVEVRKPLRCCRAEWRSGQISAGNRA